MDWSSDELAWRFKPNRCLPQYEDMRSHRHQAMSSGPAKVTHGRSGTQAPSSAKPAAATKTSKGYFEQVSCSLQSMPLQGVGTQRMRIVAQLLKTCSGHKLAAIARGSGQENKLRAHFHAGMTSGMARLSCNCCSLHRHSQSTQHIMPLLGQTKVPVQSLVLVQGPAFCILPSSLVFSWPHALHLKRFAMPLPVDICPSTHVFVAASGSYFSACIVAAEAESGHQTQTTYQEGSSQRH